MKVAVICLMLSISVLYSKAQVNAQKFKDSVLKSRYFSQAELRDHFAKNNFSKLFIRTENSQVYGFIGKSFMRIRVKIIKISQNPNDLNSYFVHGKSMVKNTIDEFNGTFTISNIRKVKNTNYGADYNYKNKKLKGEFILLGNYQLTENKSKNYSGIFKGCFNSAFYIDKFYKIHYDDIEIVSDGYINNEFVGTWENYKSGEIKICNWGDYRIPNSGDLDIGAGEFSPADKYLKYGWQSRRDYFLQSGPNYKQAKQIEEAKWWQ